MNFIFKKVKRMMNSLHQYLLESSLKITLSPGPFPFQKGKGEKIVSKHLEKCKFWYLSFDRSFSFVKFLLLIVAILIIPASQIELQASEMLTETIDSKILNGPMAVRIYLPQDYDSQKGEYPFLLLLHGSGGRETDWDKAFPVLDKLIAGGKLAPLIAFAPASGTSWWVDGKQEYETALLRDILPNLMKKYKLSPYREAWAVAGFSMGGYGAMRYGLLYHELFGGAIMLSPAIYNELPPDGSSARSSGAFGEPFSSESWTARNYPALLPEYLASGEKTYFFIGAGDDDWHHEEGLHFNIEQQAVKFYGILHKIHKNPAELRIVNGTHNMALWLPLFEEGLLYLAKNLPHYAPTHSK
jgi:enterochelin esterase-like enzyme